MSFLRTLFILAALALTTTSLVLALKGCSTLHEGPPSDHFDGRRFFGEESDHTLQDMVKWLWEMETVEWPDWIEDPPQPRPEERIRGGKLKITFINHATILIQVDGLNILTDPVWSERVGPVSWAGAKRVRAPGVKMSDLPAVDIVLISHDHYDHLDLPSLRTIANQYNPLILVGLGVKKLLKSEGFSNILEMDWWQEHTPGSNDVTITFVPSGHNSGRGPLGKNRTLWGGFVVRGPSGKVYFAGDSAYGRFLHAIHRRFSDFRLTILPIGSYEKRWFMRTQHMSPYDAVRAHILLKSEQSAGIHFGTFREHPEQTINAHEKDLSAALNKCNVPESEFWILKFGEGRYVEE